MFRKIVERALALRGEEVNIVSSPAKKKAAPKQTGAKKAPTKKSTAPKKKTAPAATKKKAAPKRPR